MSAWTDPAQNARVHWEARIPMRDGTRLSAITYLPREQASPAPAIVTMTPYIAQTFHDRGVYFAARGYPFVSIDVRGRGNSEGVFRPLINEASDGHDAVEWVARQPFCNGKIAMWGGSYAGFAQWAAARELPPHLATIVPAAAPYAGVDFPGRSQLPAPYLMQWLTLVWGRTSQDKLFWGNERYWGELFRRWFESGAPFQELDTQLCSPSPVFQEWLSHPDQDEYWDAYNPSAEQYARLDIPVLTITGIYDGDQPGALMHYRMHLQHGGVHGRARHYLVIGPWDHAGTRTPAAEFCGLKVGAASLLDLPQLHADWYAWTMQGGAKPKFLRKNVAYYVMGAEEWRYADALDAVTERSDAYYLHSTSNPVDVFGSGTLCLRAPLEDVPPDHYIYDPRDVSLARLESTVDPEDRIDQRMIYASVGRRLIYHTAPFPHDVEVTGFFRLLLWLSIDQADTDFRAAVYAVDLQGAAIQLATDSLRARYRDNSRRPKLIDTIEPVPYRFETFTFVSRRMAAGSRLRLVFGPIDSIYSQKNYNNGGAVAAESVKDARTVTVRLFHDARRPSVLYVPIGRPES
jgi:putative CocE/NonD family hydrolase